MFLWGFRYWLALTLSLMFFQLERILSLESDRKRNKNIVGFESGCRR